MEILLLLVGVLIGWGAHALYRFYRGMDVTGTKEELKELEDAVIFAITFDDDHREEHPFEADDVDPNNLLPKWRERIRKKIERLYGKD